MLRFTLLLLLILLSLFAFKWHNFSAQQLTDFLYFQDFENMDLNQNWFKPELLVQGSTEKLEHGKIIKHTYIPSKTGTPYIGKRFKLDSSVSEATLSFDMKLDREFEFVKGGKMHGLAGGTATTGCRAIDPNGWSVRMMWRRNGQPVLYLYHQDRKERCGDNVVDLSGFTFVKNTWYNIALYVKLNSEIGSSDGIAALFINGNKLIERNNLNFAGNMKSKIDYFLYNSFYGGNDPSWSPSTDTFVYYDNFKVSRGLLLSEQFSSDQ
ncbi:MAG: polysaccharide lyase [Paraglaciecola sp.]|uniref:polysaccharide lyase n=1 Tax=Paraglaciecola sp. TaxID=1920173 RepID=UPI003296D162